MTVYAGVVVFVVVYLACMAAVGTFLDRAARLRDRHDRADGVSMSVWKGERR